MDGWFHPPYRGRGMDGQPGLAHQDDQGRGQLLRRGAALARVPGERPTDVRGRRVVSAARGTDQLSRELVSARHCGALEGWPRPGSTSRGAAFLTPATG